MTTQRDRISAAIEALSRHWDGTATVRDELVVAGLPLQSGAEPERIGPSLSAAALETFHRAAQATSPEAQAVVNAIRPLLAHIDAQADTIRNQNAEMDRQRLRVAALNALELHPDAPTYGELVQAEADARAELAALRAEVLLAGLSLAITGDGSEYSVVQSAEPWARDLPLIEALLREEAGGGG